MQATLFETVIAQDWLFCINLGKNNISMMKIFVQPNFKKFYPNTHIKITDTNKIEGMPQHFLKL